MNTMLFVEPIYLDQNGREITMEQYLELQNRSEKGGPVEDEPVREENTSCGRD